VNQLQFAMYSFDGMNATIVAGMPRSRRIT
jgi:hypothetical protein